MKRGRSERRVDGRCGPFRISFMAVNQRNNRFEFNELYMPSSKPLPRHKGLNQGFAWPTSRIVEIGLCMIFVCHVDMSFHQSKPSPCFPNSLERSHPKIISST
jgi:hypothetical protein